MISNVGNSFRCVLTLQRSPLGNQKLKIFNRKVTKTPFTRKLPCLYECIQILLAVTFAYSKGNPLFARWFYTVF